MRSTGTRLLAACATLVFAVSLAACGGDDVDDVVDDARENVEDAAGSAGARAAAEAMRGALEAADLTGTETLRDVTVLQENAADIPGDPTVTGIDDTDGDGKDDDGKVQLTVGDQDSCVTVADNGEVSVAGESC